MFPRWWSKKSDGWAAVAIRDSEVAFVHLCRDAHGRPKVQRLGCFRREGNDAEVLSRLRETQSLSQVRVTTLLRMGEYQLLQIEPPKVAPEELRSAVRWKIKDLLDFAVDDAVVDILEIPVDRGGVGRAANVFVVAAPKSVIQRYVQLYQFAKTPLEVIDVVEAAQRNIATLYEHDGRSVALLAFYDQGGLLTFSSAGELLATRRIDISLKQLTDADDETRYGLFDRIGLEMQRSLDAFERQFHFVPVDRVMVSPLPENISLLAYLSANLYVPVESVVLSDVISSDAAADLSTSAAPMRYFELCGAALRDEGRA